MEILNIHKAGKVPDAIFIGRPGDWGNPFVIGQHGTREEVIAKYNDYLIDRLIRNDSKLIEMFKNLKDDDKLLCFCAPVPCHGEVIRHIWSELNKFEDFDLGLAEFKKHHIKPFRLIIAGSRSIDNFEFIRRSYIVSGYKASEIISGGAKGVDKLGEQLAEEKKIPIKVFEADWDKHGKSAGYIRNQEMAEYADALLCIWDGTSKGTKHMIDIMKSLHKPVTLFEYYVKEYLPIDDGVTHINVYSKSSTMLGRQLSNFYHSPFIHPQHGQFESVEGYWYWLSTGMIHDELRHLHGNDAKVAGKKYEKVIYDNFKDLIRVAIELKVSANKDIQENLIQSVLPFTHYYYFGDKVNNPKIVRLPEFDWLIEILEKIREKYKLLSNPS